MKVISLEFSKLRRKWIFTLIALFITVEVLWAFMSVSMSISRNPGDAGWNVVLVTIGSMNGLFLPIISATVVSRICDMEHIGNTWKLLMSANIKPSQIYAAKYLCANVLLLFAVILQVFAMTIFGLVKEFAEPIPIYLMVQFIVGMMFTNMSVIALQQWVSLSIKNQAFAMCLGMLGGFIGMTTDFFPGIVRRIFIWSYYSVLSPVTYHFTNDSVGYVIQKIGTGNILTVFLMAAIFYIAGSFHVYRQEV